MMFSVVLIGGITLILLTLALIDWLGRRKERPSKRRPAA
jgi:hypothetical protein